MFLPSTESTNPSVVVAERPAVLAHQIADNLKQVATTESSHTREQERSAPVCAAGWAY